MNDNMKIKYFDEELEVYDERRVVNKNTYSITLNYVPSPTRPLTVENGKTMLTETNGIPNANQYVLDRENGLLLFNQAMKGKVMTINYTAIGLWCISADKVYTNVDNKGKIVETLEDLMKENRQAIESIKTVGDASAVITQLQADIDSVIGLADNIAEGIRVNEELNQNIASGEGVNTALKNIIPIANNKINEMNTWVNQHGDIVDLDNRVETVETEIPKINENIHEINEKIDNEINELNSLISVNNDKIHTELNEFKNENNLNLKKINKGLLSQIHFLNTIVDENVILIKTKSGKNILIDTGEIGYGSKLLTKLNKLNVVKIDYLIISHSHSDHIGGFEVLASALEIGHVYYKDITWTMSAKEIGWNTPKLHQQFKETLARLNIPNTILTEDIVLNLGCDETLNIYNTKVFDYSNKSGVTAYWEYDYNYESLFMKFNSGLTNCLFMCDCPSNVVRTYPQYHNLGHVEFLQISHHGGNDNLSREFCEDITPNYAFYTTSSVIENVKYYKACVQAKILTCDVNKNSSASFLVGESGIIPFSNMKEELFADQFITFQGKKVYSDANGNLVYTDIVNYKNKSYIIKNWYLVEKTSDMWVEINEKFYTIEQGGVILKNQWRKSGDMVHWYYLDENGEYLVNTSRYIGTTKCTFDSQGFYTGTLN